jgi:hypothetical protein
MPEVATEIGNESSTTVDLRVQRERFPYTEEDTKRLQLYTYFEQLFFGDHFEAFKMKVGSEDFNRAYSKLRYVMINFAGLVSKVAADMLFAEPPTIKFTGGDQKFGEALIKENDLNTQFYESALQNSYFGDALFKCRVGKRHRNDPESTVILEDTTPRIYFPKIDPFNIRAAPDQQELAWVFRQNNKEYLRKEIHEPGKIINKVFLMKDGLIAEEQPLSILGIPDLLPEQDTGIDRSLIQHAPNWKVGSRWNGISDYYDLDSLFFAMNNRMTKVDNVLDQHTDPILMVPPGVLDENGKPHKKYGKMIEMGNEEDGKPEYIIWDASLENAFKEIEKIVESFMMVAEISPDVFGMGKNGAAESGRALKFKLMRTIAKISRKKLYYDKAIKEALYVAQLLAKAHSLEVGGLTLKGEPVVPEIDWQDGLPIDESEQLENETVALDAGITTKVNSAMRVYKIDEEAAEEMIKKHDEETKTALPDMGFGKNPIKPGQPVPKPAAAPVPAK